METAQKTAVVTGASRGIGKGVARALHDAGWRVFATGRSIADADLPAGVRRIVCDHLHDNETARAFATILNATTRIDMLVNGAWGGYEQMVEDGRFTWPAPFWEQPLQRWSAMMDAGVRASFVCSQHAARNMIANKSGLIANLSFWAAQKRIGNAIYGISKAATDKLTADIARELRPHNVAAVSLYPGLVRTESVIAAAKAGAFNLDNSESPEFQGLVAAALYDGSNLMTRSGNVLVTAAIARELGVNDIDGKSPEPLTLDRV
jgi:NAD(P)-dependent dehydrogenase (short-subunit alcohol dehydrogenase family)